jgi:L-ascorbate metabolism protein UlaG (beta-lactamase superfamily)
MVITHHGGACFKVSFGSTTVVVNPPSKKSQFAAARGSGDVVLVSSAHDDFAGAEQVSGSGGKEPFVIAGPGEYEVAGTTVFGFASPSNYGLKGASGESENRNTIYSLELEGMKLCFLGALSSPKLSAEAKEELDEVDILFVPVGDGTLSASDAHELSVALEPSIIIPVSFDTQALGKFLKEEGESPKPVDKLTLKKKDLEGKEGEIVVFSH